MRVMLGLLRTGACSAQLWWALQPLYTRMYTPTPQWFSGRWRKRTNEQTIALFTYLPGTWLQGWTGQAQVPTKTLAGYFWDE